MTGSVVQLVQLDRMLGRSDRPESTKKPAQRRARSSIDGVAGLIVANVSGDVVAQDRARGQAFRKPGDLVRIAFILRLFGRGLPVQKNVAAAGITSARIIWVCGFLFVNTVRCKSYHKITLQTGA